MKVNFWFWLLGLSALSAGLSVAVKYGGASLHLAPTWPILLTLIGSPALVVALLLLWLEVRAKPQ
ncbi:MAG: hypothetical protein NW237_09565 [Cyanobacteriota bacterium]|nr:hypothetical protein [Cyanobacteriota bacterium]